MRETLFKMISPIGVTTLTAGKVADRISFFRQELLDTKQFAEAR
jgi:hypothetical protein